VVKRRLTLAGWLVIGYGLVVAVLLSPPSVAGAVSAPFLLVAAALGAAAFSIGAVRSLPSSAIPPWAFLAASATVAALAPALQVGGGAEPRAAAATVAAHLLFCAGIGTAVQLRERDRRPEFLLDTALIAFAAIVVLLRWAPGLRPMLAGAMPVDGAFAAGLGTAVLACCGFIFSLMLLTGRRQSGARDSLVALTGAAALLLIAASPPALGAGFCCPPGRPFYAAFAGAFGLLALAGARIMQGGAAAFLGTNGGFADLPEPGARTRLRQIVAPLVALLIAIAVMDGALRPPFHDWTAGAIGVLGALLALRVSQLLEATRHRMAEQRQLEQSRALVEVSRALSGSTQLDDTLDRVAEWACRLLHAPAAILELLSDDGKSLEIRAAAGLPPKVLGLRFPVDGTFTGWVAKHGKPRATIDPRRETDIHHRSRPFVGKSPLASAPMRYQGRVLGVLTCVSQRPFDAGDFELLGALADQGAIALENARLFRQVDRLSKTDPLTGLANRRQLEADLAREFAAAQRGRPLIAVMFDLNRFKEYNDEHGHIAGDEALRLFGKVLAVETRSMNLAARYGGDEFCVLLSDSDCQGARIFAERVRNRFGRMAIELRRGSLSASAGFASYSPDMLTPTDLIEAADRQLYASKARKSTAG